MTARIGIDSIADFEDLVNVTAMDVLATLSKKYPEADFSSDELLDTSLELFKKAVKGKVHLITVMLTSEVIDKIYDAIEEAEQGLHPILKTKAHKSLEKLNLLEKNLKDAEKLNKEVNNESKS